MKKEKTREQILPNLREISAIAIWFYVVVKLFIFDIDAYLVSHLAPGWQWLLNLRLFAIVSVLAILWLTLGHKRFILFISFIVFYPFIVLFWKVPKLIWRRWDAFIVLLPTIYITVISMRSTFVMHTAAAVSTVVIVLSRKPVYIIPSMLVLGGFLVIYLYRAFRRAHSSGVFSQLAMLIRNFQVMIDDGSFDQPSSSISTSDQTRSIGSQQDEEKPVDLQLYMLHGFSDFIAQKVATVMRDRKYNALLVISLLGAVFMTTLVFGLENWALYRIDPRSFQGVLGEGFLQFFAYSMGHLATANLTTIQPISGFATALATVEVFCSILILVIGGFSILTAARDTYRDDLGEFTDALHKTTSTIERRMLNLYSQTIDELEIALSINSIAVVNFFRRIRGLDELPGSVDNSGDDDASTT